MALILENNFYFRYCLNMELKLYFKNHISFLSDLDKILCYISAKEFNSILSIYDALDSKFNELGTIRTGDKFDSTCESTFFKIKFFKKGTIHLELKDLDLWKEFNFRACSNIGWIPNNEKEKHKTKYTAKTESQEEIRKEINQLLFL